MKIFKHIRKGKHLWGFTMTEVIVSTLIFSLAMAGVFASISELRQPAAESTQEVTAAFIGKRILEDLRAQVNAESWDTTGGLTLGTAPRKLPDITVDGRRYTPVYTVTTDPDGTSARKVTLNITW